MPRQQFTHLHVHTEFSMLDGAARIPEYVGKAKRDGMTHLGCTDHGNLMAAPFFYKECKAQGLNPCIGCEFYFVPDVTIKPKKDEGEKARYHVVIIAKNEAGFKTLVELSTASHHQFHYKPLIDRATLQGLSRREKKNLVVLSGCAGSIVSQMMLKDFDQGVDELNWWRKLFPNFYTELQNHWTDTDWKLNKRLVKASMLMKIPWVITNDPHYVFKDDCNDHDALLAIQTASDIDDPNRFRFEGKGYHLKNAREMQKAFKEYGNEIWVPGARATMEIAESCTLSIPSWESRSWHIPEFPKEDDATAALRALAEAGLANKGLAGKRKYRQQMKDELRKFKEVGMEDFLLITQDLLAETTRRGRRFGPGRGSVAGTLVGYLIGIHKIDPIRYKLLFERFLNPERPKMPDVDMDFPPDFREEITQYARDTYGDENVMHVAAYQSMQAKRAFQNLARAYGIPYQDRLKISEMLGQDDEGNVVLPIEVQVGYPELASTLQKLVGLKSNPSSHAAGVIIFRPGDPIKDLVPEQWLPSANDGKGKMVSQYDLRACELLGLMKMDFLGLRNLATIEVCLRFIEDRHGVKLEPDDWVPDAEPGDWKIYRELAKGRTAGIFQMEGGTNHRGIQEISPVCFEDIVTCTSLYRAGPMIAGADKRFLKNRAEGKVRVAHPSLKDHLSDSWGEMIYQEQMFSILNEVAGFSWSRVDDAKTAMARKDPEKMAALKEEAIAGFQKVGGMNVEKAAEVWEMIAAQASYLFNRSHAVAYSMLTYQTARLKYLYPLEYLAACLATCEDEDKRYSYLAEASVRGFKILPPHVLKSDYHSKPFGKRGIRMGLVEIKGVGPSACHKIVPVQSMIESLGDLEGFARNKGVVAALGEAGALKCFGIETTAEAQEARLRWQFHDPLENFRPRWEKRMRRPKSENSKCLVVGEIRKIEQRKTKADKRPFVVWTIQWAPGEEYRVTLWEDADDLWDLQKGSVVAVEGKWNAQYQNVGISDSEQVRVLHAVKPAHTKSRT